MRRISEALSDGGALSYTAPSASLEACSATGSMTPSAAWDALASVGCTVWVLGLVLVVLPLLGLSWVVFVGWFIVVEGGDRRRRVASQPATSAFDAPYPRPPRRPS